MYEEMLDYKEQCLEYAVKTTYEKLKNKNVPNLEDSLMYAIAESIINSNYRGFTRDNGARDTVMQLNADDIMYALVKHAIRLSDFKHQHRNNTIDKRISSYNTVCMEYLKNNETEQLLYELTYGMNAVLENYRQPRTFTPQEQVSYDIAHNLLKSYVDYNTKYQIVTSKTPITNLYDLECLNKFYKYYEGETRH